MRKILRQSLALLLVFALLFTASSGMGAFANAEPAAAAPASALPGNFPPLVSAGDTVMFRNAATRQYLTALANDDVVLRAFTGAANQQWSISDLTQSPANREGYFILPLSALDVMLTMGNFTGQAVVVRTEITSALQSPSRQMWNFQRLSNGSFLVSCAYGSTSNPPLLTLENGNMTTRTQNDAHNQQWEIIRPTRVSFNIAANNGTSVTRTHDYLFEGTVLTPATMPNAEKDNSVFLGWHTDPASSVALQTFPVGSENVTLYAIFRDSHPVYYNVTRLDGPDATTNATQPLRLFAGDLVNLNYTATLPGARFLGWREDRDIPDDVFAEDAVLTSPFRMPGRQLNLFPLFLHQRELTFRALFGGSVSQVDPVMVFPGDWVDLSPTAMLDNTRFLGWHYDANAEYALPRFRMPNANHELFAVFERKQRLEFNVERNGGYAVSREYAYYFVDDVIDLSPIASREYARFLGWAEHPTNGPLLTAPFRMPRATTSDRTVQLFARFHDAPELTFCEMINGDRETQTIGRYFEGDVVNLANYTAMPRENARFLGWHYDRNADHGLDYFIMPHDDDFTLHAIFEDALVLTFNFDHNGGTGITGAGLSNIDILRGTAMVHAFAGDLVDLTVTATKPGWEFVGWSDRRDATEPLTSFRMPGRDVTLYAIFRLMTVVHFIDYNNAGRQVRMQTFITYNRQVPQSVTPPVQHNRTGWVTYGWTDQTTANTYLLAAGDLPLPHPDTLPADVPFATHFFYGLYQSPIVLSYAAQGAVVTPSFEQRMRTINSYDSSAPYNPRFWIAGPPLRDGYFLVEWTTGSESFQPDQRVVFGEDTLLTAVWAPGEAPVRVPVTGIHLSAVPAAINVGDSLQLLATVLPPNATARGVDWHSDNRAVATVDQYGNVTAHSIGTAVITATTAEGGFTATATITVAPVELSGIALPESNATIVVGQSLPLEAIFLPSNATNRNVTWSSNNPDIVEVDWTGRVRGRAIGDAIITVTAANGMTASMNVTVAPIRVENVELLLLSTMLHVGDARRIDAAISPPNATNRTITWSSSSTAVSVDDQGVITANHLGIATITATVDGRQFSIGVDVRPILVTDITLTPNEAEIVLGNTRWLRADPTPRHAENATLTWSTSAASIATVDAYGLVRTHGIGTAIITARTLDGTVATTARITVLPIPVQYVLINETAFNLNQGQTRGIEAQVVPNTATNQELVWRSSNTAVATVDQNGRITARSGGTAIITATARDGSGASASTIVTVPPRLVDAIQPMPGSASMLVGERIELTARVLPANACNPAYRVTVSNSRIIRYDNGVVTALAHGVAYITFTALDGGGVTASTRVIVHQPVLVEEIRLPTDVETLDVGQSMMLPTARIIPSYASNTELAVIVSDPEILSYHNGRLTRLTAGEAFVVIAATDGGGAWAVIVVLETPPPTTILQTIVNVVVAAVSSVVYVVENMLAAGTQWVTDTINQISDLFAGRRSDTTGVAWPFHNTGTAGRVDPVEDIWIPDFGYVPSPWGVNSYLYAINVRTAPAHAPDDGLMIQRYASLQAVRDAVVADVQSRGRSIRVIDGADAPIYHAREYRFALRVGHNPLVHDGVVLGNVWDYRLMVQTDTGAWAYKQGWYQQATLAGYIDPATADWSLDFAYEFNGRSYVTEFENFFNSNTIFFAATLN